MLFKTLLVALWLSTAPALALDGADAIEKNQFNCDDNSPFQAKPLLGDQIARKLWFDLGYPRRTDFTALSCIRFVSEAYKEGSPALFKFFEQVDSVKNPELLGHLLAYPTSFNGEDKDKVKIELEKLGAKFDTPDIRMMIALAEVDDRFAMAGRQMIALESPEFIKELTQLITLAPRLKAPSAISMFTDQHILFAAQALKLEVLAQKHGSEKLRSTIHELTDMLFLQVTDGLLQSFLIMGDPQKISTLHFLYMTGRSDKLKNINGIASPLEIPALLTLQDENSRLAALKIQQTHALQESQDNPQNCKLLIGALLHAQNPELVMVLSDAIAGLKTCNYDYAHGPVEFTGSLSRDSAFISGATGNVAEIFAQADRRCGEVTEDMRRFLSTGISVVGLLRQSLKAGCTTTIELWGTQQAKMGGLLSLVQALPEKPDEGRLSFDQFRTIVSHLQPKQRNLPAENMDLLKSRVGSSAVRYLKIQSKGLPEPGAQLLEAAAAQDTDELINFDWNGVTVEVRADKVNDVQYNFIESVRISQTLPQILSEAFSISQALERSISDFAVGRTGALPEILAGAKEYLDKAVENGAYNSKATSIFDVLMNARMQPTSGTDFILLHTGRISGFADADKHAVVIIRPGHVLPGWVEIGSDGVEGIETTVVGKGRLHLVLNNKILPDNVNIVLADDYLMTKVLYSALKDPDSVRAALSARAEKVLRIKQGPVTETSSAIHTNGSIFAFGRADIPEGDLKRARMDIVPAWIDGATLATLGQPRSPNASSLSRFPEVVPPNCEGEGNSTCLHIPYLIPPSVEFP